MKHIFTATLIAVSLALTSCSGVSNSSNAPKKSMVDKVNNPASKKDELIVVQMKTTMGDITLELNKTKAPNTVKNFLRYANSGHYNATIFHRVINGFMIQGGGFDVAMKKKSTLAPIKNEADNGLKNDIGTIAMARTGNPHSATAQFFINVKDNSFLNHRSKTPQGWGYTVFGKVTKGMDVVNRIKAVQTTTKGGHQNVPVKPVVILSVTVKK